MEKHLIVIAVIKDFNQIVGKGASAKPVTVGYRIFDSKAQKVFDFSILDKNGITFCMNNANSFVNVVPMASQRLEFKFTNGVESRYPYINSHNGQLVGTNPLVIVHEYNDGYRIVDAFGHTFDWTDEVTLQYAAIQGIANGKEVTKNGKKHISSISGEYPKVDASIKPKPVAPVKGKPAKPVKTNVFPDEFYKSLEPAFGGPHSVAIIKHLFENRGMATKERLAMLQAFKGQKQAEEVPTIIGLTVLGDDWEASKFAKADDKLFKLLGVTMEPAALKLVFKMHKEYGLSPVNLMAVKTDVPERVTKTKETVIIPESRIASKIASYAMQSGKEIMGCKVNEDASLVNYEGKEVKNHDTYMLSGIHENYLTLISPTNKAVKVKGKDYVVATK